MKLTIWDILSIVGLMAIVGVVILFAQFFINPNNPLNPFPPATLPALAELPTSTPTPRSLPPTWTPDADMIVTSTLRASTTPLPTATGFKLPTFTPTFTPTTTASPTQTVTVTPTPGNDQATYISQSPDDGQVFSPGSDIDLKWQVKNIGLNSWDDDYYYMYYSGWDGHKRSKYNLSKSVGLDERVELVVDMVLPKETGNYSLTWKLYNDDDEAFYTVTFTFAIR